MLMVPLSIACALPLLVCVCLKPLCSSSFLMMLCISSSKCVSLLHSISSPLHASQPPYRQHFSCNGIYIDVSICVRVCVCSDRKGKRDKSQKADKEERSEEGGEEGTKEDDLPKFFIIHLTLIPHNPITKLMTNRLIYTQTHSLFPPTFLTWASCITKQRPQHHTPSSSSPVRTPATTLIHTKQIYK